MAKFFTNSTATQAIRLEEIEGLIVRPRYVKSGDEEPDKLYELMVYTINDQSYTFETGATLVAVQTLASNLLTALEA